MSTSQLRVYRIQPGMLGQFVAEWASTVRPLREQRGFRVEAAWTIEADDRFVWILSYDGPDGFEAANEAYYASPERAALDPNPARLIEEQYTGIVTPVDGR
jgi:hypothetical protein